MSKDIRNGLLVVAGLLLLAFSGHGLWKARSAASTATATATATAAALSSSPASSASGGEGEATVPAHSRRSMLAGEDERFVLEVRGLGLAVGDYYQTVWQAIREDDDPFKSVLPQDPAYYDPNVRMGSAILAASNSFGSAAREAVERWPVPVIIIGPPTTRRDGTMASGIALYRQKESLGLSLFLWQDDANIASAQPVLERLFEFFDEHPDVPQVLLVSNDSEGMRYRIWETPGMPARPEGVHVPLVAESMTALLVSRSDRVDKLVRPYAVQVGENINKNDTRYDIIKLWNFFWQKRTAFGDQYEAEQEAKGIQTPYAPGVPRADWWIAQLPELWKQIDNKGPGDFKPSPYLPVRWTDWQVRQFDDAPLLGYIHRPVQVPLKDEQGKPFRRAGQVAALREGWQRALAALPESGMPARVFYDTSGEGEWVIPLTQALQGNHPGIDLNDRHEGYDIGRRPGNTGVSSALVQIGLAVQAGYEDGRASATVNLTPDGYAGIVMVSPPDAASREENAKRRGKNPFLAHVPGGEGEAP